jgi:hypothetical protein
MRYKLNELKVEWTGYRVAPDMYEPKHPQLRVTRDPSDPQALKDPRPDRGFVIEVYTGVPLVEGPSYRPIRGIGRIGTVTVETT